MEYIYDTARELVREHLVFQHTAKFQEWSLAGMPPWEYRRITLGGRRALGYTTAAIKLAIEFWPSIIIIPKTSMVRHVADTVMKLTSWAPVSIDGEDKQLTIKGVPLSDVVVPVERLDRHLLTLNPTKRYTLAIFDEAYLAEQAVGDEEMGELRAKLFMRSNLMLELQ